MIKISKIEGRWQNFFSEADRLLILDSQDMHFGRLVGSASLNRANAFGIDQVRKDRLLAQCLATLKAMQTLHEEEALAIAPDLDWRRLPDT
jgi:hypothetical protein